MKYIVIAAIMLVAPGFLCSKNDNDHDGLCPVDLSIVSAQTPASVSAGSNIIVPLRCSGSDLCYSYTKTEIKKIADRIYEIRTKGTYPCRPVICALAIYYADPEISITTSGSGQYILRYYNGNNLFRADTVTVN